MYVQRCPEIYHLLHEELHPFVSNQFPNTLHLTNSVFCNQRGREQSTLFCSWLCGLFLSLLVIYFLSWWVLLPSAVPKILGAVHTFDYPHCFPLHLLFQFLHILFETGNQNPSHSLQAMTTIDLCSGINHIRCCVLCSFSNSFNMSLVSKTAVKHWSVIPMKYLSQIQGLFPEQ